MSQEFVKVALVSEIAPGAMKQVKLVDQELVIGNIDGQFFALSNKCTHMGGPLSRGKLEGFVVECPWHGSKFDLRTGEVVRPPAQKPMQHFETKIQDGSVFVRKSK
jgi:nitrite reductase/ring-hydroxylating ferredoxin subunit